LVAATAAQNDESAANFMQAMHSGMQQMDRKMQAADMNGNVDHDFAAMMILTTPAPLTWQRRN